MNLIISYLLEYLCRIIEAILPWLSIQDNKVEDPLIVKFHSFAYLFLRNHEYCLLMCHENELSSIFKIRESFEINLTSKFLCHSYAFLNLRTLTLWYTHIPFLKLILRSFFNIDLTLVSVIGSSVISSNYHLISGAVIGSQTLLWFSSVINLTIQI
jgi:hypothetical protein